MSLLEILFPKFCVSCKRQGEYICSDCFTGVSFDTRKICLVCGNTCIDGLTHPKCQGRYTIDGAFCAVEYKGIVKKLVYQFKYKPYLTDLQAVLVELFYESLIQKEMVVFLSKNNPFLVPIPLTNKKLKKRGYNHAAILAQGLGKKFGLEVRDILMRSKETIPQYGLSQKERKENIQGAFETQSVGTRQQAKVVILVDDILTSGSTMLEAAKILKKNGFEKVWGIAFAKD